MKQIVEGTLISVTADRIVTKLDDGSIMTWGREYYRLPLDMGSKEPIAKDLTNKLPVKIVGGLHGILAPVTP